LPILGTHFSIILIGKIRLLIGSLGPVSVAATTFQDDEKDEGNENVTVPVPVCII
jgi:hypothetical protein